MRELAESGSNIVLLRGACLWIVLTLGLAWCLVGLGYEVAAVEALFPGKFTRVLQAHIDFLLMSALLLGFYATGVRLPPPTAWAMVIGAFTNSSLFLLMAMFPVLDYATNPAPHWAQPLYECYLFASLSLTTYGFATAAITVFRRTLAHPGTAA